MQEDIATMENQILLVTNKEEQDQTYINLFN